MAAALAGKVPALFGLRPAGGDEPFYLRNGSLSVIAAATVYFIWKRRSGVASALWFALPVAAGAPFANIFPLAGALRGLCTRSAGTARLLRRLQLLLVVSALVVDGVALAANRSSHIRVWLYSQSSGGSWRESHSAQPGVDGVLYARFVRHRGSFATLVLSVREMARA